MMNITDMSEQEKSAMLAKLCGWKISYTGKHNEKLLVSTGVNAAGFHEYQDGNLYDMANMALAWRMLNWLYSDAAPGDMFTDYFMWCIESNEDACIERMEPREAQEMWLDKILELAIEEGMVE